MDLSIDMTPDNSNSIVVAMLMRTDDASLFLQRLQQDFYSMFRLHSEN